MSRVQLNRLSSVLGAAIASVAFTVVPKGNTFAVKATVSTAGPSPVVADVADDSGKIRVFKDVDDFVSAAAKIGLINSGTPVGLSFTNLIALEPAVFTGDQVARARSQVANLQKQSLALGLTVTKLTATIALLTAVTPGEIAYKAEKEVEKASVVAQKTYVDSEVVRITALLPA
jgi:hypothetical protein